MRYFFVIICLLTISNFPQVAFTEEIVCDHPERSETVRIYYANGMNNDREVAKDSKRALRDELGMQDKDFGLSYNDNEFWLFQLINVYQQRKSESDDFWYWLRHMDKAPQWFHDEYIEKAGRFKDKRVTDDPDLQVHISQYMADLRAGKKVVIVAHSQGNFYANNAHRSIRIDHPEYVDSIGIVSVANPATWVEGGGRYPIDDVYTTNPQDFIINLVRFYFPDTLRANVAFYDNPDSWTDHGFVATYLKGYNARIIGQILQRIASLETPEMAFECKEPADVPVDVETLDASNVSTHSATLNGIVHSGKMIGGVFVSRKSSLTVSCQDIRNNIPNSGEFNTGDEIYYNMTNLSPDTQYYYRMCGREGDRVSDGGLKTFKTDISCGMPLESSGGSEGLILDYGMGAEPGYALVEFEAFTVRDSLKIYQGSKMIYSTDGYVAGFHSKNVYHNPNLGQKWQIRVDGNSNTSTLWELTISCPHK